MIKICRHQYSKHQLRDYPLCSKGTCIDKILYELLWTKCQCGWKTGYERESLSYNKEEVEKLFYNIYSITSHISTPSSEISDSSEKSSNNEEFSDNKHFDVSTKRFTPSLEHYDKFNTNNEIQVSDEMFMPIIEFHTLLCNNPK